VSGTSSQREGAERPLDLRRDPRVRASLEAYWRRNLGLMAVLLVLWAVAGLGCGVLLAEWLNRFALGGFPLGFWFAQQGSILAFVVLIGVYALVMRRFDRIHHEELEALRREIEPGAGRP
jgi:putative solute:sodium symporter small subunit